MDRTRSWVAFVVAGALFMELLDSTVIATALPGMAATFHVDPVDVGIGVTSYLLTSAVFIPLSGWVSDRLGARRVFVAAIALFTVASVLCGLSDELWQFVAARVVQAIGSSMMVPVGRVVVLGSVAKRDLMRATAIITWPALVAPVLGPPIGGVITTFTSWRWIFLLNVPLGLAALVLALLVVRPEDTPSKRPFDGIGFVLSGLSIGTLVYGMDLAGNEHPNWPLAAAFLGGGIVAGVVAVLHLRRHPSPLVDLSLLRTPTFAATTYAGSLFRLSINVVPFLLPLLFQVGFGLSPLVSGLLVLSVFAGNLVMKTVTTPVVRRFGFRKVLVGNGLLNVASLAACTLFSPGTPFAAIAVVCFLGGAVRSLQYTAINTLAFADVPKADMSAASTLNSTLIPVSIGMGIAFASTIVQLAAAGGSPSTGEFRVGFLAAAVVALIGSLWFLRLDAAAGEEVSRPSARIPAGRR